MQYCKMSFCGNKVDALIELTLYRNVQKLQQYEVVTNYILMPLN